MLSLGFRFGASPKGNSPKRSAWCGFTGASACGITACQAHGPCGRHAANRRPRSIQYVHSSSCIHPGIVRKRAGQRRQRQTPSSPYRHRAPDLLSPGATARRKVGTRDPSAMYPPPPLVFLDNLLLVSWCLRVLLIWGQLLVSRVCVRVSRIDSDLFPQIL